MDFHRKLEDAKRKYQLNNLLPDHEWQRVRSVNFETVSEEKLRELQKTNSVVFGNGYAVNISRYKADISLTIFTQ